MKEFLQILRRFVPPYKKYLGLSILFNILSAVLNIFSFAALIPILQILFQVDGGIRANDYMEWDGSFDTVKEVATHNLYYYIQEFIVAHSASLALLVIGLFLAFMTFLKTGAYFLSSATIIPIRTGIVRDIRNQLYQKITSLSLGFFSEERKGDIIARMSGVDTTGGNSWYAKAQEWVVLNGISDGENPTAAITREQLVTVLYRFAQKFGLS